MLTPTGDTVAALPGSYEIRIKGRVGPALLASFDDMEAAIRPAETVLRGTITDQAQLLGLIERIALLGLELIEIRRICAQDPHGFASGL